MPTFVLALLVGCASSVIGFLTFMAGFGGTLIAGPYIVANAARDHKIEYGLLTNSVPVLVATFYSYWEGCYMNGGMDCEQHTADAFLHYDLAFWGISLLLSLVGTAPVYIGRRRAKAGITAQRDEDFPPPFA